MAISAADVARLNNASPIAVQAALGRLRVRGSYGRWLTQRNRYRTDVVARLGVDSTAPNSVASRNLVDYVAASAPIHCCDGWSFLGRAMSSHLRGDLGSAVHLAYYAELRAAMSLLATEGIGIFSARHFVIDANGQTFTIVSARGTHQATWDILQHWARNPSAAASLGQILQPGGQPIEDWLQGHPAIAGWSPIAESWLLRVGLDLKQFGQDRDARNESSYRPSQIDLVEPMSATDAASFAEVLWSAIEPDGGGFGRIDRQLLRLSMEQAFIGTTSPSAHRSGTRTVTARRAPRRFEASVEGAVEATLGSKDFAWIDFLLRRHQPDDDELIVHSRGQSRRTSAEHHIEVMARATLLLRIASGAVRRSLRLSGTSMDDLGFWWKDFGLARGLWTTEPQASELADSWNDGWDAVEDVKAWNGASTSPTRRALLDNCATAVANLGTLEAAGLWSLAS